MVAQDGVPRSAVIAGLDSILNALQPPEGQVGVSVFDLSGDTLLYQHQAHKLFHPASNMKILTAVAALSHPRAMESFQTEVWCKGSVSGDTLRGDLYVVGAMDPEFTEAALDTLVSLVPFKVIEGRLLGDVSMKDSLYWGAGWMWDDNPSDYQPYLSPLMLQKGVVEVVATPAARGEPAHLAATPRSSYFRIVNETESGSGSGGRFELTRNWMDNGNVITATGVVARRSEKRVNVHSSQDMFMHTFEERLRERGVELSQPGYGFQELLPSDSARLLAAYETPVSLVLRPMMKESDNLNAEALFYRLGVQHSGARHVTASTSAAAVAEVVRQMGLAPGGYVWVDGSGLSLYNYLSPHLLVTCLRHAYHNAHIFDPLYQSLPIAGVDGTLEYRMPRGTPAFRRVRAKTGNITGVSALSGYVEVERGRYLAFSIMCQNHLKGAKARALQDAICQFLAKWGR